jgi:hypothetical protein
MTCTIQSTNFSMSGTLEYALYALCYMFSRTMQKFIVGVILKISNEELGLLNRLS